VILLSTKFLGLISRRVQLPAVVGALISGIILGPSFLDFIEYTDFIQKASEIGVILLMFMAGLDTDLDELKKSGLASFLVAVLGVVLPLLGGFLCFKYMFPEEYANNSLGFLKAVFVGVTLTATSVSITVETLREMGKLKGKMGTTIMGAAIDDIVGIIVLTTITSMQDTSVNPTIVLVKIVMFFIFVVLTGAVVFFLKNRFIGSVKRRRRISIYALAFCLFMSFIAEEGFGVADITGAYFAGLMFCAFSVREYIGKKFNVLNYLFFAPVFFASIGMQTNMKSLTGDIIWFTVVLTIVAILTKVVGCGLGAKICKFNNKEALGIGIGMISRGEVALIVAQKGADCGLLSETLFPAIVVVVIITTLITPILLKVLLTEKNNKAVETA
ncbi:MAG: cation:proton antiporter, partial [Muribaculaceae bacterium]